MRDIVISLCLSVSSLTFCCCQPFNDSTDIRNLTTPDWLHLHGYNENHSFQSSLTPYNTSSRIPAESRRAIRATAHGQASRLRGHYDESSRDNQENQDVQQAKPARGRDASAQEILDFLDQGQRKITFQPGKDIVVILGVTGSGKSTLALFISGHDSHLVSREVPEYSGNFIIEDDAGRISNEESTTVSKTTLPELIVDLDTGTLNYDCPGFSDNRGPKNDIGASFFTRKVIESASRVKFVFAIEFAKVKPGGVRSGFRELAQHATDFIRNVDKFKDSIALVATKVNTHNSRGLIPVKNITAQIAHFLENARKNETSNNIVKFIDILLQKNEEGELSKIGVFRKPDEIGQVSEISVLQESKKTLNKTIHANILYSQHEAGDFGYTISSESQLRVNSLIEKINNHIGSYIIKLNHDIEKQLFSREKKISDLQELFSEFQRAYDEFSKIKKIQSLPIFAQQIAETVRNLSIDVPSDIFESILKNDEYLQFFKSFSDVAPDGAAVWMEKFNTLIQYLSNTTNWYSFLSRLLFHLSSYDAQRDIGRYRNVTSDLKQRMNMGKEQNVDIFVSLKLFLKSLMPQEAEIQFGKIKNVLLNEPRLSKLNSVLDYTLYDHATFSFDEQSKKQVVKGNFVKLSDIMKNLGNDPKNTEIFALEKVFLDTDLDLSGKRAQVSIIAPTWEACGAPKIKVSGIDGKNQEKARDGVQPGESGENGLPGNFGTSAGNVFGIGADFTQSQNLQILANGGKGGSGQAGGAGKNGRDGDKPGNPNPGTTDWPGFDVECSDANILTFDVDVASVASVSVDLPFGKFVDLSKCRVSKECSDGGAGGHGGRGGKGGKAGRILFIALKNNSESILSFKNGENGSDGSGGLNGTAGRAGGGGKFTGFRVSNDEYWNIVSVSRWTGRNCVAGKPGISGHNAEGQQEDKVVEFQSPYKTLNSYKYYARSHIDGNIRGSSLKRFLGGLEENEPVNSLYDLLGLLEEAHGLERQFSELKMKDSLLPHYSSFMDRIVRFSQEHKYDLPQQDKKVLSYLYTAMLSRVAAMRNDKAADLIVDLKLSMELVEGHIGRLKLAKKTKASHEIFQKYNASLNVKIAEARNFIDREVSSDLDKTLRNLNAQVEVLIDEVTSLQKRKEQEKKKLIEKEKNLSDVMTLRAVLSGLSIASQFLSFAGPVGAAAGAAIGGGAMIAESLVLDDTSKQGIDRIQALPAAVNAGVLKIKDELDEKKRLFKTQLTDASNRLKEFLKDKPSETVQEIEGKIVKIRRELEKEIKGEKTLDPGSTLKMNDYRKELENLMGEKIKALEAKTPNEEKKIDAQIRVVTTVKNIIATGELGLNLYNKLRNDQAKFDMVADQLGQVDKKLHELTVYKQNVLEIILPACKNVEENVKKTAENIKDRSHSFLDVRKWQMQQTLGEVKRQIKKMTEGFESEAKFTEHFSRIEEGIAITIDLYNRIEDYRDKAELAAYISDVTSDSATSIKVKNDEWRTAIENLDLIILSNIVFQKYNAAFTAFKQHVFPFASFFLADYNLPSIYHRNGTDSLMEEAISRVQDMKQKVETSSAGVNKYDKYLHTNVWFNSKSYSSQPFFVWKHKVFYESISKLLQGKPVILKADITQGPALDAVKFNIIGVHFKLLDGTLQGDFDEKLRNFRVDMIYLGDSYYRCRTRFYVITSPSPRLDIQYTFAKRENGEPEDQNEVYRKLKTNEPVLSPYAIWSIKLTPVRGGDFSALVAYQNKAMHLELGGRGQYVDSDADICTEELDNFYKLDSAVSDINNIVA